MYQTSEKARERERERERDFEFGIVTKRPPLRMIKTKTQQTHHSSSDSDSYTDSSITLAYYMSDLSGGGTSFPDGDQFALSRDPSTLYVALWEGAALKASPSSSSCVRTTTRRGFFSTEKRFIRKFEMCCSLAGPSPSHLHAAKN